MDVNLLVFPSESEHRTIWTPVNCQDILRVGDIVLIAAALFCEYSDLPTSNFGKTGQNITRVWTEVNSCNFIIDMNLGLPDYIIGTVVVP